jgi:hypothetical protein
MYLSPTLPNFWFSMHSVSCHKKIGEHVFWKLLVILLFSIFVILLRFRVLCALSLSSQNPIIVLQVQSWSGLH